VLLNKKTCLSGLYAFDWGVSLLAFVPMNRW
jgi:hypothetical protein